MSYQVIETVRSKDGGDAAMLGCSRYQSRDLAAVAGYALAFAPGVRSCARLADCRRAARRAIS